MDSLTEYTEYNASLSKRFRSDGAFSHSFAPQYRKYKSKQNKTVKAYVRYFLKTNVFLCYFERSTLKRNLTYCCFFFPLFPEHLFSPRLPCATRLPETS